MRSWTCRLLSLFLVFLASSGAYAEGGFGPLFAADDVRDVTLEAAFDEIMRERPEDRDVPGLLRYEDPLAGPVELEIGLRTRGEFRRRRSVCVFAPLRLDIDRSEAAGTIFAGQDKLKLVTHCRHSGSRYEQDVYAEYLAYRLLNLVAPTSFRVRLLRVTYVDSEDDRERVKPAFLIEHRDEVAARIGKPVIWADAVTTAALEPRYMNLTSVFHFLIGNTDFSPLRNSEGRYCCHNHTLFGREGELWYSVPFDFDFSGFVNAPYAAPNPRFELTSVRQRLYRGRCRNNAQLEHSFSLFREQREAIDNLIVSLEGPTSATRKRIRRYIRDFFAIIDRPERVERYLIRNCLG